MNCAQIEVLSREDFPIDVLNIIYDYFSKQMEYGIDQNLLATEAETYLNLYLKHKHEISVLDRFQYITDLLPLTKDTLIGEPTKRRIHRAWNVMSLFVYRGVDSITATRALDLYVMMLYAKVDHRLIKHTIKSLSILQDKEFGPIGGRIFADAILLLEKYPSMLDDFAHNKLDSLFLFLMNHNLLHKFAPTPDVLQDLYNAENHQYAFDIADFDKYFTTKRIWGVYAENMAYIASQKINDHPMVPIIQTFCEKHLSSNEYNEEQRMFSTWSITELHHKKMLENIEKSYEFLRCRFDVETPARSLIVRTSPKFFTSITYSEYNKIIVDTRASWRVQTPSYSIQLLILPDGRLMRVLGEKNTMRPLTMVEFISYMQLTNIFGKLMRKIFQFYKSQNRFFDDVILDARETALQIPLTVDDVRTHYNRAHLLKDKYKLANKLSINWNKQNLSLSYMILKAYPKVETGISQQILLQQKDVSLVETCGSQLNEKIKEFLTNILYNKIEEAYSNSSNNRTNSVLSQCQREIDEEMKTDLLEDEMSGWFRDRINDVMDTHHIRRNAYDYVNMCMRGKTKIRLDVRSAAQMTNMHDAVNGEDSYYRKNTSIVKIPAKSVFLGLRKILPEEFEWIKTRKRLILETELQHHCVWSYAEKISRDACAIYSFVDKEGKFAADGKAKRYTIEFAKIQNKYVILQVQGKFDRVNTSLIRDYIQYILDEAQADTP